MPLGRGAACLRGGSEGDGAEDALGVLMRVGRGGSGPAGTSSGSGRARAQRAESEDEAAAQPPPSPSFAGAQSCDEDHAAADEMLQGAQVRIECAKVCAPGQLAELVEGSHAAIARLRGIRSAQGLHRLLPVAVQEHQALLTQWQQRSGTIRVVVRIRPAIEQDNPAEVAVSVLPGGSRSRGLTIDVRRGLRSERHTFKRFDYILDGDKDQDAVFRELQVMLPSAQVGLGGPPQSACVLAYGQTGSGKTHTMHGGDGKHRGLVPRVLEEVFRLGQDCQALISLSVVEIYNDIAYDLLDDTRVEAAAAAGDSTQAGRGFQAGRLPPPAGLNFRHGCASALSQASCIQVGDMHSARTALTQAADRRSTRSTCFNATSSRSHSIVLVNARLPDSQAQEPALRIAFVDLAGSERLPASENKGPIAEESRHINLSLSALGSVVHALRHRSNHLPYRACLATRLLEPFFGSSGRVLLCVCVSPEQRFAQETLCSLNFADRASRAILGADCSSEVQRGQALNVVREACAVMRSMLRGLLPRGNISPGVKERLPDRMAELIILCMPEHGEARFVCRAWARICGALVSSGRKLQHSRSLAEKILRFADCMNAAGVCRCWWSAASAYRITVEVASAKVSQAHAGSGRQIWAAATARARTDMWKALLCAGGGSGTVGEPPLSRVRECVIAGYPKPEGLKQVLMRCPELRVAEIAEPELVSPAFAGLMKCPNLRALKCSVNLVPNIINLRQVLTSCRQLKVLSFTTTSEHHISLQFITEELPKRCALREFAVARCSADWKDLDRLAKSCPRLTVLRLPHSYVESGDSPLSPPPLLALARLKHLQVLDLRAWNGKKYKQRPWLTDDMFGFVSQLKELRDVRVTDQKLIGDRCFVFLRRHASRLRQLHLDGCKAMCGDIVFGVLHCCEHLESLKLPVLQVGESGKILGTGTARWCQGLRCPRLRELCVDGWSSLEDAGVLALARQCGLLRVVWLRHAPRISDDATAYLAALRDLTSLCMSGNAGLTDRSLAELAAAAGLRYLDLSGCRQLSEAGVCKFAAVLGEVAGPSLRSLQLDACPHLGRAAIEALARRPGLARCSLSGCRPLPLGAAAWADAQSRAVACEALGLPPPPPPPPQDGDEAAAAASPTFEPPPGGRRGSEEAGEPVQCAICMDDIAAGEAAWECPVCCNRLHDTEDCARGWLRLRQSCPTCRAAAWAPPEEPASPNPFRSFHVPPAARARPTRSLSADAAPASTAVGAAGRLPGSPLADLSIAGLGQGRSVLALPPSSVPVAVARARLATHSAELLRPRPASGSGAAAGPSRRPPRPAEGSPAGAASRLAAALAASPAALALGSPAGSPVGSPAAAAGAGRSRSLPPRRPIGGAGLALAGLAIVGSARS